MASSSSASSPEPPLPLSIETLLRRIYDEQFMSPLDSKSRHQLALLGEEAALNILQRFRSLPDYITFMVRLSDSASRPSVSQSDLYDSILESLMDETSGDTSLCSSKSPRQINFNSLCLVNPSMETGSFFDSNKNHSDMVTDSSSAEVPLPHSVEKALRRIGEEQLMPPLDSKTRRELAFIGEEAALRMLQRFRSLSDYITFMVGISDSIPSQGSVLCSGPQTSWSSLFESQQDIDFSGVLRWEEQKSTSFTRQINLNSPTFMKPIPSAPMLDYLTDHSQSYSCNSEDAVLDSLSMEEGNRDTTWSSSCSPRNLASASFEKRHILDSPILASLGELEFRKAFIILSYCGKKKLEDVATVGLIERIKNLPMKTFEAEAWRAVGCKCIEEKERSKNVEWDSGKTYLYHCHVDPDATYTFKGPYLQKHRTHLQRVLGDENVLNVKFVEREMPGVRLSVSNVSTSGFHKIADEGILVGFRRYHFFVFKDGGKEEKKKNPTSSPVKCFFVCMEAEGFVQRKRLDTSFNMSVHEARCVFMHVHTVSSVAKYMARLSLILSKTVKLEIDLAMVNIDWITDIPCLGPDGDIIYGEDGEPLIHTDGTGFISEDLAWRCPRNIYKVQDRIQGEFERVLDSVAHDGSSSVLPQSHIREPPLLIQCRLFINGTAVKGTFLVNKKLPPNTIQIRDSMIKVETDPKLLGIQSANSLEIVSTSYRPRKTSSLSRYLIALLNYGGVSTEFFMELVANSLEDARTAHFNKRVALKVSLNYGEMDDFIVPRMILCGIPLDEPYLRDRLSVIMREERKGLKDGKLPITECYYLMGTTDPTGMLKDDEVCVILDHGHVSGEVLVYRHPGLHFGDIHLLTATATLVKEMEEVVGNSKYAIFFPSNGPRSLASEIANGDFDGDMYWVSRNPELLASYNPSEPWTRKYSTKSACQPKPDDFSHKELEDVLFQQFLTSRFHPSNNIGSAADSWLAFMDRLLILNDDCVEEKQCLRRKMLQLVDVYYDALDAPKTGKKVEVPRELKAEKFPHYMGRSNFYRSKSVLGQIYDMVDSFQTTELLSEDIWKLPCFEEDVPRNCLHKWDELYMLYKREMASVLKIDDRDAKDTATNGIILKYKQILYGAPEFEETTRDKKDIFDEALAIYHLAYDYAKQINAAGRCGFPWKVAGRALCTLYAIKQDKETIVCQKSVLREIFN